MSNTITLARLEQAITFGDTSFDLRDPDEMKAIFNWGDINRVDNPGAFDYVNNYINIIEGNTGESFEKAVRAYYDNNSTLTNP